MKAWEVSRSILRQAKPVVLDEEEQKWRGTRDVTRQLDAELMREWKSNVPGSAAPDCLMAGAIQSLENKGFMLEPYGELLQKGREAADANDMELLQLITMRLRRLMRAAVPDPDHPSQRTRRFSSWSEFALTVDWPADVEIDTASEDFARRIDAGWKAQLIGAAMGTALEGYTAARLYEAFGPIRDYMRPPNTYNDDITYELAFLEAYAAKGPQVTSADIGELWARLIPRGWSAETVALTHLRDGVYPPKSGSLDNPYDEWIGAQMRGAICGMMAPGRAKEAARLAWIDAEISHAGNGILGEIFNAVLVARAFVVRDTRTLLEEAVRIFPSETEYRQVLDFALNAAKAGAGWEDAWKACDERFAAYHWIHAYPNAAAEVVALWHGNGHFDSTLEIVSSIGHDADCNAAQIMTVIAIEKGLEVIDRRWLDPLGKEIVTFMRRPEKLEIAELVAMTLDAVRKWY